MADEQSAEAAVGRAVHEELSRIDIMRYLEMPDDTANRVARAAIAALPAASEGEPEPVAWADVVAERKSQIEREGYTPEHDDKHDRDHALARAAACYALAGTDSDSGPFYISRLQVPKQVWPYRWEWKPGDRRRNLLKAAALLLAEIERVDRATLNAPKAEAPHDL